MIATQTQDLLRRLRKGTHEDSNLTFLERVSGSEWIAELKSAFRLTFQERHIGGKWQVSLARTRRTELVCNYWNSVICRWSSAVHSIWPSAKRVTNLSPGLICETLRMISPVRLRVVRLKPRRSTCNGPMASS